VTILDADKEGFLRSERSLIQTIGRAARNLHGKAILYADRMTGSMQRAIDETERRRAKQLQFNIDHNITPKGVQKSVQDIMEGAYAPGSGKKRDGKSRRQVADQQAAYGIDATGMSAKEISQQIAKIEDAMFEAAKNLQFEQAAQYRDQLHELKAHLMSAE
jgi:excinuclease ABC subunit B